MEDKELDSAVPVLTQDTVNTESVASPESMKPTASDNLMQDSLFDLIVSMLIVVSLIVAVVWLLRKMPGMQRGVGRNLRFIDGLNVGQKERVVLVEVAGERILLGVASGSVNLLKIMPVLEQDSNNTAESEKEVPLNGFAMRFAEQLKSAKKDKSTVDSQTGGEVSS